MFDKLNNQNDYESNVYTEMANKYHFEETLKAIADKYGLEWVTLQGESYGAGVQKRDYGLDKHEFMGFNLIFRIEDGLERGNLRIL